MWTKTNIPILISGAAIVFKYRSRRRHHVEIHLNNFLSREMWRSINRRRSKFVVITKLTLYFAYCVIKKERRKIQFTAIYLPLFLYTIFELHKRGTLLKGCKRGENKTLSHVRRYYFQAIVTPVKVSQEDLKRLFVLVWSLQDNIYLSLSSITVR